MSECFKHNHTHRICILSNMYSYVKVLLLTRDRVGAIDLRCAAATSAISWFDAIGPLVCPLTLVAC